MDGADAGKKPGARRRVLLLGLKLLMSLTATGIALLASEGIVRLLYPEYGIPVFTTKLLTEFDPLLGWRKIPNFRGAHVQEEYTIVEQFNSKGLRGPEYPYEKPGGEYRILILGDSFAEGYTVEFPDLFSEVLERKLNDALETPVEVINAGTGGYSTDQELLFFQTEGKKYAPDLVVVLYCTNDAPMNVRPYYHVWKRGQKPLFELVDGELRLKSKPKKTWDREELNAKDLERHDHAYEKPFNPVDLDTWFLYRLYKHATRRETENVIHELPLMTDAEAGGAEAPPEAGTDYQGPRPQWVMTEALMAEIRKEAAGIGCAFLLYHVPTKGEVYGRSRKSRDEHNLRVLSRRHDMDFIPTIRTFRKQAEILGRSGKRLYWKKDSHWTPEGHHLTGLILAEHILANWKRLSGGQQELRQ